MLRPRFASCPGWFQHTLSACVAALLLIVPTESLAQMVTLIDFEHLARPPGLSGGLQVPSLSISEVTFHHVTLYTAMPGLVDQTTIITLADNGCAEDVGPCTPIAHVIDFAHPVSNFSIYLMNGHGGIAPTSYTLTDDRGGSATVSLDTWTAGPSSATRVSLPSAGIRRVMIQGFAFNVNTDYYSNSFALDDVRYTVDSSEPDPFSIVAGSVVPSASGPVITATFVPNGGLSLDEAAHLLGYDHFNWLNVITSAPIFDPVNRDVEVLSASGDRAFVRDVIDAARDANGNLPAVPFVDPVLGGYRYQHVAGTFPDQLQWYWDEHLPHSTNGLAHWSRDMDGDGAHDRLDFLDRPASPSPFPVEFMTGLVGVFPDGSAELIPGTIFEWRYAPEDGGEIQMALSLNEWLVTTGETEVITSDGSFVPFDVAALLQREGIGIRGESSNRAPVARARNITLSAGSSCLAPITPAQIDDGSSDPDGDGITLSLGSLGPFALGSQHVTLIVTDSHGAQSTATAIVTVVDTTPPVVTAPAALSAYSGINGQAPIPDVLSQVVVSDNCGAATLSQSPVAGALAGIGAHTIAVTAVDGSTNASQATTAFTVVAVPAFTVSVTPGTVRRGNKVTLQIAFNNPATTRQTVALKVSLTTPSSVSPMVTLPITLQSGQSGTLNIPLVIPKSTPIGVYTLTLDVYVGAVRVGTSTTQLIVTS